MRQTRIRTAGEAGPITGLPWGCVGACLAKSQDDNVFGLRPFLAGHFVEADGLPFRQGFEPGSLDRTEMHEQVAAVFALDESESFALVEPLDGSGLLCCHINLYEKNARLALKLQSFRVETTDLKTGYYGKAGGWSRNVSTMDRNYTDLLGADLYTPPPTVQQKPHWHKRKLRRNRNPAKPPRFPA